MKYRDSERGKMNIRKHDDIPLMWQPNQRYGECMRKFKKFVANKYNIKIDDYWDLHKWSVDHLQEFWAEFWDFSEIIYSRKFEKVIYLSIPMEESPAWFEGAKINLAENLLKYRNDKTALIIPGEGEISEKLTFAQLYEESKLYAAAFRKFGLKKGDVVACQISNRKEATLAMIAVASIGGTWASVLSLLGSKATLSRIKQVEPKVYLTIDRIPYARKSINMLEKIKEVSEGVPSLRKVIIVPSNEDSRSNDISAIKNSCFLDEFLEFGKEKDGSVQPMQFEHVSFTHPVYINFTSGTSGMPKALVHGTGFLLARVRDFLLHLDAGEGSIWFTHSPPGWVTWNAFTNSLFCGVTLVLFEEPPFLKSPTYFWDLADKYGATHLHFPTSVLDEMRTRGYAPTKENSLESVKVIIAGGSIVKAPNYDFIYEKVKKDILFSSIYGCTETLGPNFFPDINLPVYRGECPAVGLGVQVEILDDYGKPVIGEIGDIVIANPIPNLPLGLWNDKDNSIFRENYFSKFPGKFAFNDNGIINPFTKGIIICGRSDETIKIGSNRIGSSEIYNVVVSFTEVSDSLCVSQSSKTTKERIVLFLKIREGYSFSDELVTRVREAVERELGICNLPFIILETKDIPYNINGKKLEIVVKKIINNKPYNDETAINPESLKSFHNIPELQGF